MKLFVAGKWTSRHYARQRMTELEQAGHSITYDWMAEEGDWWREFALEDMQGVRDADALVLIIEPAMEGAWVEVGIALALGKTVYVEGVETYPSHCIFLCHPAVRHIAELEYEGMNASAIKAYSVMGDAP